MHLPPSNQDLSAVVDLMRNLSLQTDPQQAAALYGQGLMKFRMVPNDRYLSISRRNLDHGRFRITRNTGWTSHPNPWKESHKLPILTGGILAEAIYSNQPVIIKDLSARLTQDDPAYDTLHGFDLLVSLPHFDHGQSINAGVLLNHTADNFPFDQIPIMIWVANLWGRATLNLVNSQKLQAAYDAMDHELKVVADIQRSLLPRDLPQIPGIDLAAHYQTSQRAGGDYYDFFPLPNNQWGILLADVSGHGTPAAVLMAITHAIAHTHPGHPMPPEQLLSFVNAHLARHYTTTNGNFVTALYAILAPATNATPEFTLQRAPATHTLAYASAGHPSPRLLRDKRIECVPLTTSFPLGIHGEETFTTQTLHLRPGDKLLFYTDGIPDTFNPTGDAFGTDRLDAAMLERPCDSADGLVKNILAKLDAFSQSSPVTDDRTLLAMAID